MERLSTMMHFLELPRELLHQIMRIVGGSFFREDVQRLTVCKDWYPLAHAVFWEDVTLSARTLRRLLHESGQLEMFNRSTRRLGIWLDENNTWDMGELPSEIADLRRAPDAEPWRREKRAEWVSRLDGDLAALTSILDGDGDGDDHARLEEFHFTALRDWEPFMRKDYLLDEGLPELLLSESISINLVSLELDTSGTAFLPTMARHDHEEREGSWRRAHICAVIGRLLPQLQRLRLRMHHICATALRPPPDQRVIYLTDVAVKLSYSNQLPGHTHNMFSEPCWFTDSTTDSLRVDVETQARELAGQMAVRPKTLRVLRHIRLPVELQSLDVLTGKRMIVSDDMAWDEDGETVCGDWEVPAEMEEPENNYYT